MSNVVRICNLAVSRIGESASIESIDPPDGSAVAEHCALLYPIARDSLLEMHPWNFATYRAKLALLNEKIGGWEFAYARPSDVITVLSVLPIDQAKEEESVNYTISANSVGDVVILTDEKEATIKYTRRSDDPQKYSPLFIDALAWLLASYIAGPIIKGNEGAGMAKNCYQNFLIVMSMARNSDSGQKNIKVDHQVSWIGGR